MTSESFSHMTLLRVTISSAGVSLRRMAGEDPFVLVAFGHVDVPDPDIEVLQTCFFYNWLVDADGRKVGVEACVDLGRLNPKDRCVLAESGMAVLSDVLTVQFVRGEQGKFLIDINMWSVLTRTPEGLDLLLEIDDGFKLSPGIASDGLQLDPNRL